LNVVPDILDLTDRIEGRAGLEPAPLTIRPEVIDATALGAIRSAHSGPAA
jgi:hypothetical protein